MSRKTITVQYGVQMNEPRRFPSWLKMLFILVAIVGAIYAGYYFVIWVLAPTEEDVAIINATPTILATPTKKIEVTSTPTIRPEPTINAEMSIELASVLELGEHMKGWVYIPGLGLNTAVVQWKDNYFFRDADINLNTNSYGSVYLDYRSDPSYIRDTGNIVIYGYNNLGGRQLKSLLKYVNEEYFGYNTLVIFETVYGSYNFRIFSVHIEDEDTQYTMPIESGEQKAFIEDALDKSMFVSEYVPENDSVVLTFSVDVESASGNRFLVHAFLEDP